MLDGTSSVLITGGCGFVGLNFLGYLLDQEDVHIRVLDNLSVGTREDLENFLKTKGELSISEESENRIRYILGMGAASSPEKRSITLIIADIRNRQEMFEVIGDNEAIAHLAAQTGVIESVEDPFFDFEQNAMGLLNVLDSAVKHTCPGFVFASSAAPIGDQPPPSREDLAPKPLSPYGATKLAGEGYCSAFHASYGLPTCSLRFSNVYGPYSTFKTSVIAQFIRQALLGETLTIFGDGNQTRDFVHTQDLSQAIYRSLTFLLGNGGENAGGEIFQIATGEETSINKLFGMIKEMIETDTGQAVNLQYAPPRAGEIYRNYADISKARQVLGFTPEIDIEKVLRETWDWFKSKF
jgi:UDP-glucose 4-epimerase